MLLTEGFKGRRHGKNKQSNADLKNESSKKKDRGRTGNLLLRRPHQCLLQVGTSGHVQLWQALNSLPIQKPGS
jgi:hypothetical protein